MKALEHVALAALAALPVAALPIPALRVTALPVAVSADEAAVAALLERARAAHGIERFAAVGKDLLVDGTCRTRGLEGPYTLRFDAHGRYVESRTTRLPSASGFDGAVHWLVDHAGIARTSWFEEKERAALEVALLSGAWCVEGGPIVVLGLEDEAADVPALKVRPRDGELAARLELDPETALPAALTLHEGRVRYALRGWSGASGGLALPAELEIDDEGSVDRWTTTGARVVEAEPAAFAMPATRPRDTTFEAKAPAALEARLTRSQHLVVRARLGDVVKWFIFDSGAGAACIDPGFADELELPAFGELQVGGAGAGRLTSRFREAAALTVGPMTMTKPVFIELEMGGLGTSLGVEIEGILGYDQLQRVVAVVDMTRGSVELHDPATFAREGVTWRDAALGGNHPHVRCTFEHQGEEEGMFRLDTGAGGLGVIFHAPFVERIDLLDGRKTLPASGFGGVGGESRARTGRLSWFELGGVVFDEPLVLFGEDERGAFADRFTAGTIGSTLLARFDLIFDYPHSRIGFVPHEPDH